MIGLLLRALKSIFSALEDTSQRPLLRGEVSSDRRRDDGRGRSMTKGQFLTELEKLTEAE